MAGYGSYFQATDRLLTVLDVLETCRLITTRFSNADPIVKLKSPLSMEATSSHRVTIECSSRSQDMQTYRN